MPRKINNRQTIRNQYNNIDSVLYFSDPRVILSYLKTTKLHAFTYLIEIAGCKRRRFLLSANKRNAQASISNLETLLIKGAFKHITPCQLLEYAKVFDTEIPLKEKYEGILFDSVDNINRHQDFEVQVESCQSLSCA